MLFMKVESSSNKLILASGSPRRRELLALLGYEFDVIVPRINETPKPGEKPRTYSERLAREKAWAIQAEGIIIAADTIVVRGQKILGKPSSRTHAHKMLSMLSGRRHKVITSVCIRKAEMQQLFSVTTAVHFRPLQHEEIDRYIATGEPMDKAGSYAIQGGAAHMVRAIKGSYTNVVGLPLCELQKALISFA